MDPLITMYTLVLGCVLSVSIILPPPENHMSIGKKKSVDGVKGCGCN
jgi:hypothetical protein